MPVKRYIEQTDRSRYYYWDDFTGSNFDNLTWGYGGSTGGSIAKLAALGGQIRVTVGATAGYEYFIVQDTRRNFNAGSAWCNVRWRIKVENTANVMLAIGFQTDGSHVLQFVYNSTVGANWYAYAQNGASSTSTDTGVAVDTNWHELYIEATASSVQYFLDNVLVATISTVASIPTGDMGPIVYMYRNTGGSGTRSCLVDWVEAFGGRP